MRWKKSVDGLFRKQYNYEELLEPLLLHKGKDNLHE